MDLKGAAQGCAAFLCSGKTAAYGETQGRFAAEEPLGQGPWQNHGLQRNAQKAVNLNGICIRSVKDKNK